MISTSDLRAMPDVSGFERLARALAALDATMCLEWEDRYYSFDPEWGEGEMMASMRNGCGDHWFAVLCAAGVALHGLSHESPQFRPGEPQPWVFDQLPSDFRTCLLEEPAFDTANSTFCVWRLATEDGWRCGEPAPDAGPDGSAALLSILDGDPRRYVQFASEYYERELDAAAVGTIYRGEPMTPDLATRLNPDAAFEAVCGELRKIGYPVVDPADRGARPSKPWWKLW